MLVALHTYHVASLLCASAHVVPSDWNVVLLTPHSFLWLTPSHPEDLTQVLLPPESAL